jgi:hypothetical protein
MSDTPAATPPERLSKNALKKWEKAQAAAAKKTAKKAALAAKGVNTAPLANDLQCSICNESKPSDQYAAKQCRRSADKRKCSACVSSYTGPSYWADYHAENPSMKPGTVEASHHAAKKRRGSPPSTTTFKPAKKEDFAQVYNLPDPRPYYAGLVATDYRMPEVLAKVVGCIGCTIVDAQDGRKADQTAGGEQRALRVVDFACGFGAVGAILRHEMTMAQIYAYYASAPWQPEVGTKHRLADVEWHARFKRANQPAVEITGLDVAGNALEYACEMGLIDKIAHEDLVKAPPSTRLRDCLHAADLVIEAGGVGSVQHLVFAQVLKSGARPWILRCPKPDVDWEPLNRVLAQAGYMSESIGPPIRYRKTLGAEEDERVRARANELGLNANEVIIEGYIAISVTLSRPVEAVEAYPLAELGLEALCRQAGCFDA